MFNDVIKLVAETKSVDDYGDIVTTETETQVFAKVASISQKEFYQAQGVGLKPEIKFVIADFLDYANQDKVRYKAFGTSTEKTYSVIRTYRDGNAMELYCSRGIE